MGVKGHSTTTPARALPQPSRTVISGASVAQLLAQKREKKRMQEAGFWGQGATAVFYEVAKNWGVDSSLA
jgi:hypothetical protein